MGPALGFSLPQAGRPGQGRWVFPGGSRQLFISPVVKPGRGWLFASSAGGNALTSACLCCFPAACLEIRNSSWSRAGTSPQMGTAPGGGPRRSSAGCSWWGQEAVPHQQDCLVAHVLPKIMTVFREKMQTRQTCGSGQCGQSHRSVWLWIVLVPCLPPLGDELK